MYQNSPSTKWNVNLFVFLIHAHQKYVTLCIPWQHRSYTPLARPLLSACVKEGWGRDYYNFIYCIRSITCRSQIVAAPPELLNEIVATLE